MNGYNQQTVTVKLVVKAIDKQSAEAIIAERLTEWFAADLDETAPYRLGSLLHWTIENASE